MTRKIIFAIAILLVTIQFAFAQVPIAPIEYIKNAGQWDAPFEYKGTTPRGDFFLSKTGFTYLLGHKDNSELVHNKHHGKVAGPVTLNYHAYRMNFINPNPEVQITDAKQQTHYHNYFIGNDQSKWKSNIHPALNVDYKNLYKNIDAHIYSENGNLKYDFIVRAGGNIQDLAFEYEGANNIKLKKKSLEIYTSVGDNIELPPYAYQIINGEKVEVSCDYVLSDNKMSYSLGKNYNASYDLIIDPIVVFCTFTGSTADNWGYTATYDSLGNFYAGGIVGYPTGSAFSGAYPVTVGAFQATFAGGGAGGMGNLFRYDASISKFNSTGTTLLYATYLGGIDNDQPQSLVVDHAGNLVIAGRTYSNNYPTTTTAYDGTFNGNGDLFVTKLNWGGTALIGSTYVGGTGDDGVNLYADELVIGDLKHNYSDDARSEVIVDSNNNVYVAASTSSSNFPVVSANQATIGGMQDGIVFKLNNNCSSLLWSTFIGGTNNDAAYVLSLNKKNYNELFVAGGTMSSTFPTTAGTIHPTFQGGLIDGWLRKYNTSTNSLVASTFIGTSAYDQVYGVQTDDSNYVYIMGQTQGAYPVIGAVYSNAGSSQFATKINNNLTANLISTVFGKGSTVSTDIAPNAFLVDQCGNIYISGWGGPIITNNPGNTTGLPVTANALQSTTDGSDFYFIVFDKNFSSLLYASFFGQDGGQGEHVDGGTSRFDPQGVIYQAICARCSNQSTPAAIVFPTTVGVYSPNNLSTNCNLASVKIDFQIIGANAVATATPGTIGCIPLVINFGNNSTNSTNYLWDFGDGSPTTVAVSPAHTYTIAGTFIVKLVAYNANGCLAPSDTATLIIIAKNDSIINNFTITKIDSCNPFNISVNNLSVKNPGTFGANATFLWAWGDGNTSTGFNPGIHNYTTSGSYNVTLTIIDTTACNSPQVSVKNVSFINNVISTNFTMPDTVCPPFVHTFTNTTIGNVSYLWNFGNGNTSTLATPGQTYSIPGTYTITLIIADPLSCNKFDSAKQILHVKPTITAAFTTIKGDTCDPYILSITNTSVFNSLYPSANTWTTVIWNFGDGTTSTAINPISHTYNASGIYTITLIITDTSACNSPQTFSQVITFIDNNVNTNFILPDTGCVPFVWSFNNNTTNGTTFLWNFGTLGATSTSSIPTYTFTTVGTYTVTLLVQNPLTCNLFDTASQVITIVPNPIADFYYLPNPPLPNKPVSFNNQSTGAISYSWDFGDGTGSTIENPTHLYNKSANLIVCLTAYNEYGCPDTACKPIRPEVVNIIDVPTAFSPNGDGINDFIQVRGYGVKEMIFKIYNRFGELVFSSTNLNDKWDGKYKGKLQEMEAFAYVLNVTFTDDSAISKKGNITLIY
jgi:gliding motility-associated-like protein